MECTKLELCPETVSLKRSLEGGGGRVRKVQVYRKDLLPGEAPLSLIAVALNGCCDRYASTFDDQRYF